MWQNSKMVKEMQKTTKALETQLFEQIKEYMIFWEIPKDWDALGYDANVCIMCLNLHIEDPDFTTRGKAPLVKESEITTPMLKTVREYLIASGISPKERDIDQMISQFFTSIDGQIDYMRKEIQKYY